MTGSSAEVTRREGCIGLLATALASVAGKAGAQPREVPLQPRLTQLDKALMTPEHEVALAKINRYFGFTEGPAGPFLVCSHQAGAAEGTFQLFLAHRHERRLERDLFEIALLAVIRDWAAHFPWAAHSTEALKLGVSPEAVEAIRLGRTPVFARDDQRATYELVNQLVRERKVDQRIFDQALAVLGPERLIAVVNAASFYALISLSTVAFETPILARLGTRTDFPPLPATRPGTVKESRKTRMPVLDDNALTPAQRVEVAKLRAHFKRDPAGPFQIWAHQPGVANGAFQLYLTHRYEGTVSRRLMEIMTIVVARDWGAQFVWSSHALQAAETGVSPAAIEAIRVGKTPSFDDDEARIVYAVVSELSGNRAISQATFERAVAVLGTPRLVALVNGFGFYTMICMATVAFEAPALEGPGAPARLPPRL